MFVLLASLAFAAEPSDASRAAWASDFAAALAEARTATPAVVAVPAAAPVPPARAPAAQAPPPEPEPSAPAYEPMPYLSEEDIAAEGAYMGGLAPRDPSEWSGLTINMTMRSLPDVTRACVMKEGVPVPMGADVYVRLSSGSRPVRCAAAFVGNGTQLNVPEGSVIHLLTYDPFGRVYEVEQSRFCRKSKPGIQVRGLMECGQI